MKDLIEEALKATNIPCFYLKRPPKIFPCIVYSYKEYPNNLGDGIEESLKFDIYINLYIKDNITINLSNVKTELKKYGFIKQVINSPMQLDGQDFYQVVLNYIKTMAA